MEAFAKKVESTHQCFYSALSSNAGGVMVFVSNKLVAAYGVLEVSALAKGRAILVKSTPANDDVPRLSITNVHFEQLSVQQCEKLCKHICTSAEQVRFLIQGG